MICIRGSCNQTAGYQCQPSSAHASHFQQGGEMVRYDAISKLGFINLDSLNLALKSTGSITEKCCDAETCWHASDLHHCWIRVCLTARQYTN